MCGRHWLQRRAQTLDEHGKQQWEKYHNSCTFVIVYCWNDLLSVFSVRVQSLPVAGFDRVIRYSGHAYRRRPAMHRYPSSRGLGTRSEAFDPGESTERGHLVGPVSENARETDRRGRHLALTRRAVGREFQSRECCW